MIDFIKRLTKSNTDKVSLTSDGQDSYHQKSRCETSGNGEQKMKTFNDFLNFVRPSEHSKYSPSSADRWLITGCPGSTKQCEGIPNETSKYAEEGTMAHEYCEHLVRNQFAGIPIPNDMHLRMAMLPDQGSEMHLCAEQYVEVVSWWLNNPDLGDIVWWGLEKGVPVFPEKGCFGTGDCIVVGTKGAAMIDFKYGKGKNVSATTSQLKVYSAGLAKHIPINPGMEYPITAVVHQPRTSDAAKEHTYSHAELIEFLGEIERSIDAAEAPSPELRDGNHCFWCPARRTRDPNLKCPVIADRPRKLAQENFDKFLADANQTGVSTDRSGDINKKRDEAIVKLMALLPAIQDVVKMGEEEFEHRIQNGEAIEGVRIVEKMGNRKINADSVEDAKRLIQQHFPQVNPVEIVPAKEKLRTLTQLEKELGKGKMDALCVRPVTKKVEVIDEKTRQILDSMSNYAATIQS